MSKHDNILSDQELYDLFKQRLLEQGPDDAFNQKLMDMELHAFTTGPLLTPDPTKEAQLLKHLAKGAGPGTGATWLFTGLSAVLITLAVFVFTRSNPSFKKVPVMTDKHIQVPGIPGTAALTASATEPQPTGKPALMAAIAGETPQPMPQEETTMISDSTAPAPETPPLPDTKPVPFYAGPAPPGIYQAVKSARLSGDSSSIAVDTLFRNVKRLEVTGLYCNVTVSAQESDQVSIKGEMNFDMKGLILRKPEYRLRFEQKDSVLRVWLENPKKSSIMINGSMDFGGQLSFAVPRQLAVVVKNAGGNVVANGLYGKPCHLEVSYGTILAQSIHTDLTLRSSSGGITFQDITGNVDCKVSYGNIRAGDIHGNIKITSSSGHIQLAKQDGNLDIVSSYGNMDVNNITGNLSIKGSSGYIKAKAVEGRSLTILSSYGNIALEEIGSSSLTVKASSGEVTLRGIRGTLSLSCAYGNQHLTEIHGDAKIRSSSGNVDINDMEGNLSVTSVYGHVTAQNCHGTIDMRTQSGNIKGKNLEVVKTIELSASYGNIDMNLKNAINDLSFNLQSSSGSIHLNKGGVNMESNDGKLKVERGEILVKSYTSSGNQHFN